MKKPIVDGTDEVTVEKKIGIESKINEVYFERVFNMGNYETCRIGLKATVTEEFGVARTLQALDRATVRYRKSME
jgi:hypothetical protein